jgi:hypothetical protein
MTTERIQESFDVFLHDGDKAMDAVQQVSPGGKQIYYRAAQTKLRLRLDRN